MEMDCNYFVAMLKLQAGISPLPHCTKIASVVAAGP
jgi:hypothetical protein